MEPQSEKEEILNAIFALIAQCNCELLQQLTAENKL